MQRMIKLRQMMRRLNLFSVGLASMLVCLEPANCVNSQQKKYEPEGMTVHKYQIDGLTVQTGDLICTNTTEDESVFGKLFWRIFGTLIPGEVDHFAVYAGPGGRCVEAGAKYSTTSLSSEEEAGIRKRVAMYCIRQVDLNTDKSVQNFPGVGSIVFPQKTWSGCEHERGSARTLK